MVIISVDGNVCGWMGPQTTINDMACLYWQPSHASVSFRDIKALCLSNNSRIALKKTSHKKKQLAIDN